MQITINVQKTNESLKFECKSSEQILIAGLRSGLNLPYECGTGTCGACKAEISSGEVHNLWVEAPGSKSFKPSAKSILMCQSTPIENTTLDLRSLKKTSHSAFSPSNHTGFISRTGLLNHDVMIFEINLNTHMNYESGQFILLKLPGINGYRAYSMIDHDNGQQTLRLIIKRKSGGKISEQLFDGDAQALDVEVFGPMGTATFSAERDSNRDLICVAGGTGIAGLMSIISEASESGHFENNQCSLFFGVRSEKDLFFTEVLSLFAKKHNKNLRIFICLSESEIHEDLKRKFPEFEFYSGFVHDCLSEINPEEYIDPIYYLAGPPIAVESTTGILLKKFRATVSSIRFDRFG